MQILHNKNCTSDFFEERVTLSISLCLGDSVHPSSSISLLYSNSYPYTVPASYCSSEFCSSVKMYPMHCNSKQGTYYVQFSILHKTSVYVTYSYFSSSLAGIGMNLTC